MNNNVSITPLSDSALLITLGNGIDDAVNERVMRLFYRLQNFAPWIIDVVPAYSSLAVYYDVWMLRPSQTSAFEQVKTLLLPLLTEEKEAQVATGRQVVVPVCYAKPFAPDLEELSVQKKLSTAEIIHLHTAKTYRVYMLGFLPGFPYMGTVDQRIATPRKSSPRALVPAGSVGIAGAQTGIYPFASPGGWQLVGRTPLQLFDKTKTNPVLLQPGDSVRFISISEDEFNHY